MIGRVERIDHVDGVPRADLGTVLASNASIQIDVAPGLQAGVLFAGHFIDTVNGADLHARFTPGASVGVNHGQDFGNDFARLASQRRCCHGIFSGSKRLRDFSDPHNNTGNGNGAPCVSHLGREVFAFAKTAGDVALFRPTDNHYRLSGVQGQG